MNLRFDISSHSRIGRLASAGMAALAVVVLAGCAAVKPVPPELQVRQLATQRWQAMLAGKFDQAYALVTPAYRRIHSADEYKNKRQSTPVKWLSAEVYTVECQTDQCVVRILLKSKPVMPLSFKGVIESAIDETWVQEEGRWWSFESL